MSARPYFRLSAALGLQSGPSGLAPNLQSAFDDADTGQPDGAFAVRRQEASPLRPILTLTVTPHGLRTATFARGCRS